MLNRNQIKEQLYNNDNWTIRRRWLRIGMIALALNAEWALFVSLTATTANAMATQIFVALLGSIVALFGTYVFGATWDDNNKRYHMGSWHHDRDPGGDGDETIPGELETPGQGDEE
jgi:hypothetical protein